MKWLIIAGLIFSGCGGLDTSYGNNTIDCDCIYFEDGSSSCTCDKSVTTDEVVAYFDSPEAVIDVNGNEVFIEYVNGDVIFVEIDDEV